MIDKIINRNIRTLKKVIDFRDNDEKWLNDRAEGKFDKNLYFWKYCGEKQKYVGKLEALIELREELKKEKKNDR